jgi:hypothetical protein
MKAKKNWLMNLLSDTKTKHQNYYTGIDDMPLFNWIQCNNGKLELTRLNEAGTPEMDIITWETIYNDYLKEFGLSETYKRMLNAMKKKAVLELDFVITGDRFKLTEIEIEETRLKGMLENGGKGMTIEESLIYISKWLGTWLNTKQITVREYFNLLEQYGKANKSK